MVLIFDIWHSQLVEFNKRLVYRYVHALEQTIIESNTPHCLINKSQHDAFGHNNTLGQAHTRARTMQHFTSPRQEAHPLRIPRIFCFVHLIRSCCLLFPNETRWVIWGGASVPRGLGGNHDVSLLFFFPPGALHVILKNIKRQTSELRWNISARCDVSAFYSALSRSIFNKLLSCIYYLLYVRHSRSIRWR